VLVVADDVPEARRRARAKWGGLSRHHVDAVLAVDVVDWYAVSLSPTTRRETAEVDLTCEAGDQ
jgi:hypothetical protein